MRLINLLFVFSFLCHVGYSYAGVVIGANRIIYNGTKKEVTLYVENPDNIPYLIQTWADQSENKEKVKPFIITPPVFRLDSSQKNAIRIFKIGTLPENKESMFWLNVKSIPSTKKIDNSLQLAIKTQIKLIYRPDSLSKFSPEKFTEKLQWKQAGNNIIVNNPTPFYMNFSSVSVDGKKINKALWVGPYSKEMFKSPINFAGKILEWSILNDYGAEGETHSTLL